MDKDHHQTSAAVWIRPSHPLPERLTIGLLYLISTLIFLFLQISVVWIFLRRKEFRSNFCYVLMAVISIVDIPQLAVNAYGGIIVLFDSPFAAWLEKIAGGLAFSFSIASFPLEFLLALNRLLVFWPTRLLTDHQERLLFRSLVTISTCIGLLFLLIYLGPHSTIVFRHYAWEYLQKYEQNEQTWLWVSKIGESLPFPFLIGTFFIYLIIIGILIEQRHQMSQQGQQHMSGNTAALLLAPHERRLLLQALLQFAVECSLCSIWFWKMIDPNIPTGTAFTVFSNWYWMFFTGFKPLLYIALNRPIRAQLFQLWGIGGSCQQLMPSGIKVEPIGTSRNHLRRASSLIADQQALNFQRFSQTTNI